MGIKMNSRIITKNQAADSKIRSPQKSILEPMGHGSHPTAWELMDLILLIVAKFDINQGEYFNASLVPTSGTKLTTA